MVFITTLEKCLSKALGREVVFDKIYEPLKVGDIPATYASTDKLQEAVGFKPSTIIEEGLQRFAFLEKSDLNFIFPELREVELSGEPSNTTLKLCNYAFYNSNTLEQNFIISSNSGLQIVMQATEQGQNPLALRLYVMCSRV